MSFQPRRIPFLLILLQICLFFVLAFHTTLHTFILKSSENEEESIQTRTEPPLEYSTRPPLVVRCEHNYKISLTFDDGPHPLSTPVIVRTLDRQKVKGGFFVLGTSIQSYLDANKGLRVKQFERPRVGYLLVQDYSLVEDLFDGHDIYLHGWLHEKNNEMRLQTVVDNISTQLIEIGLLKGFKPIYRAPWGMGTANGHVKNKALITQVLAQMGIIPALWDIDTKDYFVDIDEEKLINRTLNLICMKRGGQMLMHDNRPTTAYLLDRMIRSIEASGHTIVSPGEINRTWNDQKSIDRTRKYTELLRERTRKIQQNPLIKTITYRPVEISLPTSNHRNLNLQCINPLDRYQGSIRVSPNINDTHL